MWKKISRLVVDGRIKKMRTARRKMLKEVDNLHVRLQRGNEKTGINCWTVSLLPAIDCCKNCKECMWDCYDIKNVLWQPAVVNDRARNSAIHFKDIRRFWSEVNMQIKANFVTELRINVGGDLSDEDFAYVAKIGCMNPQTKILFFTKNYEGINKFLDNNTFTNNVHPIMSAWLNTEMSNPHNLPCSHVLYPTGETTAPKYGSVYCGGNCSECAFEGKGCWTLGSGEHVIFEAH